MGGRGGSIRNGGKEGGGVHGLRGGVDASRGGLSPSFKGGWKALNSNIY